MKGKKDLPSNIHLSKDRRETEKGMHRLPRSMKQRERELTSEPDQARRRVTCRKVISLSKRVGIQGGIQEDMKGDSGSEMLAVEALLDPSVSALKCYSIRNPRACCLVTHTWIRAKSRDPEPQQATPRDSTEC